MTKELEASAEKEEHSISADAFWYGGTVCDNHAAVTQLVEQCLSIIYRIVYTRMQNHADSEDIIWEVLDVWEYEKDIQAYDDSIVSAPDMQERQKWKSVMEVTLKSMDKR